jgi:hypothetical protein
MVEAVVVPRALDSNPLVREQNFSDFLRLLPGGELVDVGMILTDAAGIRVQSLGDLDWFQHGQWSWGGGTYVVHVSFEPFLHDEQIESTQGTFIGLTGSQRPPFFDGLQAMQTSQRGMAPVSVGTNQHSASATHSRGDTHLCAR